MHPCEGGRQRLTNRPLPQHIHILHPDSPSPTAAAADSPQVYARARVAASCIQPAALALPEGEGAERRRAGVDERGWRSGWSQARSAAGCADDKNGEGACRGPRTERREHTRNEGWMATRIGVPGRKHSARRPAKRKGRQVGCSVACAQKVNFPQRVELIRQFCLQSHSHALGCASKHAPFSRPRAFRGPVGCPACISDTRARA